MRRFTPPSATGAAIAMLVSTSHAEETGSASAGLSFARAHCAECHVVESSDDIVVNLDAPDFPSVANTPGMTSRALAVWLQTSHPTMPNFILPEEARDNIREGQDIAPPLRRSQLFPPLATHMIAVGEKSGKLEDMLVRVADAFETDVETTVQGLTALIEPLMILFMGSIIGFIALSILLPIFQINQIVN